MVFRTDGATNGVLLQKNNKNILTENNSFSKICCKFKRSVQIYKIIKPLKCCKINVWNINFRPVALFGVIFTLKPQQHLTHLFLQDVKTKGVFIIYTRGWYWRETNLKEKKSFTQPFNWPIFFLPICMAWIFNF